MRQWGGDFPHFFSLFWYFSSLFRRRKQQQLRMRRKILMNAPTFEQAQYHIRWMTVHYFLLKKERKVLLVLYIPTVYVTFVYFCAIVSGHSFLDWCHVNAVAVGSFHVVKCLMLCMCFIFFWRDLRVRAGSFSPWWYISSLLHVWNFFLSTQECGGNKFRKVQMVFDLPIFKRNIVTCKCNFITTAMILK